MRAHLIQNGVVMNTIEIADETFKLEGFDVVASDIGGIGWTYSDGVFSPPVIQPAAVVVPSSVSMRQARLALLAGGKLQAVNDAIASMEGVAGEAARIEWEYASSVERNSELVAGMGVALSMTSADLDNLFIEAAKL